MVFLVILILATLCNPEAEMTVTSFSLRAVELLQARSWVVVNLLPAASFCVVNGTFGFHIMQQIPFKKLKRCLRVISNNLLGFCR